MIDKRYKLGPAERRGVRAHLDACARWRPFWAWWWAYPALRPLVAGRFVEAGRRVRDDRPGRSGYDL